MHPVPASSASRLALLPTGSMLARPRLLVSVTSEVEAHAALRGGADVLDIKDPQRGSLGCAAPGTIEAIARLVAKSKESSATPLTVALGECEEWDDVAPIEVPTTITLAKLGLAGLRKQTHWQERWTEVRRRFGRARSSRLDWVGVAYVDDHDADSPAVDDVAAAAIETGCRGVLLDTFNKSSGSLLSYVTSQELQRLAGQLHAAGLFLAVAGRLRITDLAILSRLPVDILAVRSAACVSGDRNSRITEDRVAACRQAIAEVAAGVNPAC